MENSFRPRSYWQIYSNFHLQFNVAESRTSENPADALLIPKCLCGRAWDTILSMGKKVCPSCSRSFHPTRPNYRLAELSQFLTDLAPMWRQPPLQEVLLAGLLEELFAKLELAPLLTAEGSPPTNAQLRNTLHPLPRVLKIEAYPISFSSVASPIKSSPRPSFYGWRWNSCPDKRHLTPTAESLF